jgi:hypothetical protein
MQHLDRGFMRFADLPKERGPVGDGAGDDLFRSLPGPLPECSSESDGERGSAWAIF